MLKGSEFRVGNEVVDNRQVQWHSKYPVEAEKAYYFLRRNLRRARSLFLGSAF